MAINGILLAVTAAPQRLDSWKEIAAYLGRDVTTAIRWEKERGLPVHRVPGGRLSRVFAYSNELDEWLKKAPEPSTVIEQPLPAEAPIEEAPPRRPRMRATRAVLIAGAAFSVVAAIAFAAWRPGPDSLTLSVSGDALVATDSGGRVAWSHPFTGGARASSRIWSFRGPLGGGAHPDLLAVVDLQGESTNAPVSTLHRFSHDGQLLWSLAPGDQYAFRAGAYGPPWASWHVAPYHAGADARIAWSVHHYTWWPSILISLDPEGRRTGTFVNSGWISRAAGVPGGSHLAVVGMSNATQAYFLAILDARSPSGASPEAIDRETACLSCPSGGPLHYFVFPRSDVGRAFAYPADPPDVTVFEDGSLRVQVMETPGPNIAATVYEFDAAFRLRGIQTTDSFVSWHNQLEASGAIKHNSAVCPDRRARAVRTWTPASGWIE